MLLSLPNGRSNFISKIRAVSDEASDRIHRSLLLLLLHPLIYMAHPTHRAWGDKVLERSRSLPWMPSVCSHHEPPSFLRDMTAFQWSLKHMRGTRRHRLHLLNKTIIRVCSSTRRVWHMVLKLFPVVARVESSLISLLGNWKRREPHDSSFQLQFGIFLSLLPLFCHILLPWQPSQQSTDWDAMFLLYLFETPSSILSGRIWQWPHHIFYLQTLFSLQVEVGLNTYCL